MITRCNLPDWLELPGGAVLKPVIGGHLEQKPFLTVEHSGVDVTKNGWGDGLSKLDPHFFERAEERAIIREAKRRKLKYRIVSVLGRNLRGKTDLHGRAYAGTKWVFVEVPKTDKTDALRREMFPQIPADFPVKPLLPGEKAEDQTTCFTCGLSWDDAIVTSMTPAPAARCPFEQFHAYGIYKSDRIKRDDPEHAQNYAAELLHCAETLLAELVLADPTCSGGHRFAAIKQAQRVIAKARS